MDTGKINAPYIQDGNKAVSDIRRHLLTEKMNKEKDPIKKQDMRELLITQIKKEIANEQFTTRKYHLEKELKALGEEPDIKQEDTQQKETN